MHITEKLSEIVELVHKEILEMSEEEQSYFFRMPYNNISFTVLHQGFGMHIRNKYNLWSFDWDPEIVDGIDYSPYHPDQVTITILEEVWKKGQFKC